MKLPRLVTLGSVTLVGVLALSACGSDNTSGDAGGDSSNCPSGTLNAEGSSAQANAIDEAIASYNATCPDVKVNYNPTGSGAGIKQFNAGQVDFAGSDSALKTVAVDGVVEADAAKQRCDGNEAWNLPMAVGPISISYNLEGVTGLTLTPSLISQIFLGKITSWDDPKIAAANSGVTLPKTAIKVFYRSDESGTTENFEKYLSGAAGADWTGGDPSKVWAGKVGEGREKSSGVAEGVSSTPGGITYVEWGSAINNKLSFAKVDNGGGAVELTGATAGAAATAAKISGTGNDLRLTLDYTTKDPSTYPIVLVTYEIVCSKGLAADKTALVKSFLTHYSSTQTQASLADIGYGPLPAELQTKVAAAVAAIS
ncbi:phosphate ABC transporter substrate-binding protein PstS [Spongisporangium articulatum]|uniref:Phosphate-binding protein n=1 Tax=Spongisporangium articulatum TaxID=3362603 RepID=A0ABW8AJR5_9ACTN